MQEFNEVAQLSVEEGIKQKWYSYGEAMPAMALKICMAVFYPLQIEPRLYNES